MAKTRDRVSDVKPYVERAIKDEEFRDNLKSAFVAARGVYDELMYDSMTSDEARNQAYREAIARVVPLALSRAWPYSTSA